MSPPAVVYVVAAVFGVAAVFAFKEFVYEPHIAPKFEAWAEDFLERRRAERGRRASAVPVRTSRHRNSPPSSVSSHQDDPQGDRADGERAHELNNLDAFELEAIASREVDEWRNEVLRSQEKDGLRKRTTSRLRDEFDSFDIMSSTLDESFASLTHTPLASTHVISNLSSPMTPSTVSLPQTPTRRLRSESQSTTQDVRTSFVVPHSPPSAVHGIPTMAFSGYAVPAPRPPVDGESQVDTVASTPLAIPIAERRSPLPQPLPFTPTYQVVADDSPFGPLLPDTPRSSAEIYGERPFSPLARVVESSSSSLSGSKGTLSSRAASTRTLGSSTVLRKPSRLANEVVGGSDDGGDEGEHTHPSSSPTLENTSLGTNGSIISSLSERYPAPPTPPVILSPPASSVGILSAPSSPGSGGSEVVVHHDVAVPDVFAPHPSVPTLQLPLDVSSPRLTSRSHSGQSTTSPALSYASFLSPLPMSHAASESEGDEFMSVVSNDSDWSVSSFMMPGRAGPVHDRANNPFLDFEHFAQASRSEVGGGSEGSEVLVSEGGQSEAGSDESWGSARGH